MYQYYKQEEQLVLHVKITLNLSSEKRDYLFSIELVPGAFSLNAQLGALCLNLPLYIQLLLFL